MKNKLFALIIGTLLSAVIYCPAQPALELNLEEKKADGFSLLWIVYIILVFLVFFGIPILLFASGILKQRRRQDKPASGTDAPAGARKEPGGVEMRNLPHRSKRISIIKKKK